jgi:hypothetical protein
MEVFGLPLLLHDIAYAISRYPQIPGKRPDRTAAFPRPAGVLSARPLALP